MTSAESKLDVVDGRTGRAYGLTITADAIRATDLEAIQADDGHDPHGLASYDPALVNTAACRSAITFIDGDRGVLRYRGYPIEQLPGRVRFLDVAYLLVFGDLPDRDAARGWANAVAEGALLPEGIAAAVGGLPPDAHPMAALLAGWSTLAAHRNAAQAVSDPARRQAEIPRFIGAIASLVGLVVRHRTGRAPISATDPSADYATRLYGELFPSMHPPDAVLTDALDTLLILQADHEQNCSTNAVRAVASSRVEPYSAMAAGLAALYGPLHGGANEAAVRMLHEIGTVSQVPAYIDSVKHGERKLMGFGHRVYKSYDPRAKIIKATMERVFAITGTNPLLDIALAVEAAALEDSYFIERKLYPNVDFYSGLIYEAMGLPIDTYTAIFAAARMTGWVAHWIEAIDDPEQKITRPRQIYVGPGTRDLPA